MQEAVPALIKQARVTGATWEQVGRAMGMTRQAAHQRYSLYLPEEYAEADQ